jgi:Zn-dependent protease with chaperone function
MSTPESLAASPVDGLVGSLTPPRVTAVYTCGLAAVAVAMLLLPAIYVAIIGALGYALLWYARLAFPDSPNILTAALYASPLMAGTILIFFTLKPFLAERRGVPVRIALEPACEPALVAIVNHLCELLHAPRPSRIEVDLQPNASASLQGGVRSLMRRRIVLTIGLPLIAGLSRRELAGVLAHELSHFAQGAGMRLTYIIASINLWFARVAFERDKWDEWLEKPASADPRLTLAIVLARGSVAVTRTMLKGLFWIGHAISCFLLRQMEYNADRCQALFAGSAAFESCSRRIEGMSLAWATVGPVLQLGLARRELPDDLASLVAHRHRLAGKEIDRFVEQRATKPTRFFDTHPALADRILAVRRMGSLGVYRGDGPASDLFSNLTEISRAATRQFYEQNHLLLEGVRLVPSRIALADAEGSHRSHLAVFNFYEGEPFYISPLPAERRNAVSPNELLKELFEARQRMRRERARTHDSTRRYEGSFVRLLNLTVAHHLIAVGVELSELAIGVWLKDVEKVGVQDAIAAATVRALADREAAVAELALLERAAVERIDTALALLPHTQDPLIGEDSAMLLEQALKLGAFLNTLDATHPAMRELHIGTIALNALENAPASLDPSAVKNQISALSVELMATLQRVVAAVGDYPHLMTDSGSGTVAAHLGGPGELTLIVAVPRLFALIDQYHSRLLEIVMAVEDAWRGQLAGMGAPNNRTRGGIRKTQLE